MYHETDRPAFTIYKMTLASISIVQHHQTGVQKPDISLSLYMSVYIFVDDDDEREHYSCEYPFSDISSTSSRERLCVQSAPNSKDIDRWSEMRYQTTLIK